MKTSKPGSKKLALGLVAALVILAIAAIVYLTAAEPRPAFTLVEWGIQADVLGDGQHAISMTMNVEPLLVEDLQEIGGSLV